MENDLPKIDIPTDWIIGTDISKEILSMYTNYPCLLKAGIFVLCMRGDIEASINVDRYHVKALDFVSILPGSILQIHQVEGDLRIYFMGFSSGFIQHSGIIKSSLEIIFAIRENPVISMKEKSACLLENYCMLLIQSYGMYGDKLSQEIIVHIFSGMFLWLKVIYLEKTSGTKNLNRSEQISKEFGQLVMSNYMRDRNVSFYAKKIGITQAHLCTTVKQVTGKTCTEIISAMVIMDAKAQLKSTDSSIQEIAYSLSFSNMSFFGKYFKRYVSMSPLEYRLK